MAYDRDNIFAKMIRGEVPCDTLLENDHALAFHDISPAAPSHILVVPKGEFSSFDDFMATAGAEMVQGFFQAVREVAHQAGLQASGYRLITNHGKDASQSVPHFHVHVLGGRALGGLVPGDAQAR